MPWELIGGISIGQLPHDRDWTVATLDGAAEYLRFVVGECEGFEPGVMWHEHDLGDYPTLGVVGRPCFRATASI